MITFLIIFQGPQGPPGSSATIDGLSSDGEKVNLSKSIIPDINKKYDLGSAEYKIRHLYLSDNSLYLGDNLNRISNNPETNSIKINKLEIGELGEGGLILKNITKDTTEALPFLRINPDTGEIYF